MTGEIELKPLVAKAEEKSDEKQTNSIIEHEIECPRCKDSMTLCSDFDSLYYNCEACDFTLYAIKK